MRRRDFVKFAAAAAISTGSPVFADPASYQLIIIGAGAAGLTCACIAAENNIRRILILEKNSVIGGSSIISRGTWFASETPEQKRQKETDTHQQAALYLQSEGLGLNDNKLISVLLSAGRDQMIWFEQNGIRPRAFFAEKGVRRIHRYDMPSLLFFLRRRALSLGVEIRTGCPVNDLIQDVSTGRVMGVNYTRAGSEVKAYAALGVVLCSGGFSRNKEMLESVRPGLENIAVLAPQGLTGDGLRMALKAGADTADLNQIKASYAFTDNPSSYNDMTFAYYYGPIIVNDDSTRFVSESAPYKEIAQKVIQQREAKSYLVFDEHIRRTVSKLSNANGPLKEFWETGIIGDLPISIGRTVEEVAISAHIDPVGLKDTVTMYNEAVTKLGIDPDYYRKDLSGKGKLTPIMRAPFYVIAVTPALLGTYGGLKINQYAQVLCKSGSPIPGLWAAGEVTGGMHGAAAVMGAPLAAAFAFGRQAALSVSGSFDKAGP